MHQRGVAADVYHGGEWGFASVFKEEAEQARLFLFDEFRQRDGGVHVGERVVGVGVFYTVGGGELFQAEHGQAVFIARPFYALGAQGVAGADDVEQVPAGVAVLVAVFVGVEEVAVEGVAGDFVVVTDVVVAHDAGVGLGKFGANPRGKFGLGHAFLVALLRGDAGNQHGFGRGQVVVGLFAIECDGVGDGVEIGVGADTGKLGGAGAGGVDAECFVVVEEEGGLGHGFLGEVMVGQPENGGGVFRLLLGVIKISDDV